MKPRLQPHVHRRANLVGSASVLLSAAILLGAETTEPLDRAKLLCYRLGALENAVRDLDETHGTDYPKAGEFLNRASALRQRLDSGGADGNARAAELESALAALQQEALLANPLLHSNQLLLVKRRPGGKRGPAGLDIAMPSNHECNSSLDCTGYAYGLSADSVWVHLYGAGQLDTRLPGGDAIQLSQTTDYPWDGRVSIRIDKAPAKAMALRLRIPGWVEHPLWKINGHTSGEKMRPGSYSEVLRGWKAGDVVELQLPMPVVLMESHPLVEETRNQLAVMRGPLVYCLEDKDLPPGVALESVRIERDAKWQVRHEARLLHGVTVLETQARVVPQSTDASALYRRLQPPNLGRAIQGVEAMKTKAPNPNQSNP